MKKSRHVLRCQGLRTPSPQFPPLPISLPLKDVMVWKHLIYPFSPQVIFEATVSEERQGYIALDDIGLLNYPCCKYPAAPRRSGSYLLTFIGGGGKYRVMPPLFKEPNGFAECGLRLQGAAPGEGWGRDPFLVQGLSRNYQQKKEKRMSLLCRVWRDDLSLLRWLCPRLSAIKAIMMLAAGRDS